MRCAVQRFKPVKPSEIKITVREGDILLRLSKEFDCSVSQFAGANLDKIRDVNKIYAGDTLQVPDIPSSRHRLEQQSRPVVLAARRLYVEDDDYDYRARPEADSRSYAADNPRYTQSVDASGSQFSLPDILGSPREFAVYTAAVAVLSAAVIATLKSVWGESKERSSQSAVPTGTMDTSSQGGRSRDTAVAALPSGSQAVAALPRSPVVAALSPPTSTSSTSAPTSSWAAPRAPPPPKPSRAPGWSLNLGQKTPAKTEAGKASPPSPPSTQERAFAKPEAAKAAPRAPPPPKPSRSPGWSLIFGQKTPAKTEAGKASSPSPPPTQERAPAKPEAAKAAPRAPLPPKPSRPPGWSLIFGQKTPAKTEASKASPPSPPPTMQRAPAKQEAAKAAPRAPPPPKPSRPPGWSLNFGQKPPAKIEAAKASSPSSPPTMQREGKEVGSPGVTTDVYGQPLDQSKGRKVQMTNGSPGYGMPPPPSLLAATGPSPSPALSSAVNADAPRSQQVEAGKKPVEAEKEQKQGQPFFPTTDVKPFVEEAKKLESGSSPAKGSFTVAKADAAPATKEPLAQMKKQENERNGFFPAWASGAASKAATSASNLGTWGVVQASRRDKQAIVEADTSSALPSQGPSELAQSVDEKQLVSAARRGSEQAKAALRTAQDPTQGNALAGASTEDKGGAASMGGEKRRDHLTKALQAVMPAVAIGAGAAGVVGGVDGYFEMVGLAATTTFITYDLIWASSRDRLINQVKGITDHRKLGKFLRDRNIVQDQC
eukprot:SM000019S05033  [mRNA]  locus=s19:646702:650058:+ [translate_table: standard]